MGIRTASVNVYRTCVYSPYLDKSCIRTASVNVYQRRCYGYHLC